MCTRIYSVRRLFLFFSLGFYSRPVSCMLPCTMAHTLCHRYALSPILFISHIGLLIINYYARHRLNQKHPVIFLGLTAFISVHGQSHSPIQIPPLPSPGHRTETIVKSKNTAIYNQCRSNRGRQKLL